ncbi:MAG: hypothetical protein HOW73_43360 [Polyangiaceae bacterium]|nr:hypothetical protein [Polyangiaceae bacterium]
MENEIGAGPGPNEPDFDEWARAAIHELDARTREPLALIVRGGVLPEEVASGIAEYVAENGSFPDLTMFNLPEGVKLELVRLVPEDPEVVRLRARVQELLENNTALVEKNRTYEAELRRRGWEP